MKVLIQEEGFIIGLDKFKLLKMFKKKVEAGSEIKLDAQYEASMCLQLI